MSDLRERLEQARVPAEDEARERALRVVRAAYREWEPEPPRRAPRGSLLGALVALALIAGLALTPPGQAVTDWVRDRLGHDRAPMAPARPALDRLPAAGAVLVGSPSGAWVVRRDGSKRLLGPYDDPTWSPMGLFVAAVHHDDLVAMTPTGRVRWTLRRAGSHTPTWSPSGYRIAYVAGGNVRVVAGDGTGDRRVGPGQLPGWAPGTRHVLAYADPAGGVRVVNTDARRELWRAGGGFITALSWSADGRRLAAAGRGGVRVFTAGGVLVRRIRGRAAAVAFAPRGRDLAIVRSGATGELAVRGRTLFAGAGPLGRPVWSPDGRWLLLSWPRGRQWLFVHPAPRPRVVAAPGVPGEFATGPPAGRREPPTAAWCCER